MESARAAIIAIRQVMVCHYWILECGWQGNKKKKIHKKYKCISIKSECEQ